MRSNRIAERLRHRRTGSAGKEREREKSFAEIHRWRAQMLRRECLGSCELRAAVPAKAGEAGDHALGGLPPFLDSVLWLHGRPPGLVVAEDVPPPRWPSSAATMAERLVPMLRIPMQIARAGEWWLANRAADSAYAAG